MEATQHCAEGGEAIARLYHSITFVLWYSWHSKTEQQESRCVCKVTSYAQCVQIGKPCITHVETEHMAQSRGM